MANRKSQIADRKSPGLAATVLALVILAVYWPATRHGFVNYDDTLYVTANAHVQAGLTLESMKWALLNPVTSNWHPLTVWSHMADCQLFGLNPWGHHLTSVLLHALSTVLVFLFLRDLTGAFWRSVVVAALFGLHPAHVESVAWVAERKDVLSACFGLLSLIFYVCYAEKSVVSSPWSVVRGPSSPSYLLALLFFALGLMSKPMLVTWPFVMLLLDWWPLGRMQKAECRMENVAPGGTEHATRNTQHAPRVTAQSQIANRKSQMLLPLLLEKLPFLALAVAVSVITFVVQQQEHTVKTAEEFPMGERCGNALISYCRYLGKLFWPKDLAVFYPHLGHWPVVKVLLAGVVLAGVSGLLFWQRLRHPMLLMGWLWYCGTLVPVIQLVQTGGHAMADRYTYLPSLGVLVLAVWGAYGLVRGKAEGRMPNAQDGSAQHATRTRVQSQIANRKSQILLWVAGAAVIVLCLALTRQQLEYWQDSETLFRHAVAVTDNNYVAYDNLGTVLGQRGQFDEAIRQFQEAVRLKPDHANAHSNLGLALDKTGQTDESIREFREAIRLKPDHASAHCNLGLALEKKGQMDEALRQFQEAIRLEPRHVEARNNLGVNLGKRGQLDAAILQLQEALRLKPDYPEAHNNLGTAFLQQGRTDEAIAQYREALRLKPDYPEAQNNLARAMGAKNSPANR